jgi:hypothetical protein
MRETKPSADAIKASEGRLRKLLFVVTSRANHGFAPTTKVNPVGREAQYQPSLDRSFD